MWYEEPPVQGGAGEEELAGGSRQQAEDKETGGARKLHPLSLSESAVGSFSTAE